MAAPGPLCVVPLLMLARRASQACALGAVRAQHLCRLFAFTWTTHARRAKRIEDMLRHALKSGPAYGFHVKKKTAFMS